LTKKLWPAYRARCDLGRTQGPTQVGLGCWRCKMASNPAEKENLDLADLALAREDGAKRLKACPLPAPHARLLLPRQHLPRSPDSSPALCNPRRTLKAAAVDRALGSAAPCHTLVTRGARGKAPRSDACVAVRSAQGSGKGAGMGKRVGAGAPLLHRRSADQAELQAEQVLRLLKRYPPKPLSSLRAAAGASQFLVKTRQSEAAGACEQLYTSAYDGRMHHRLAWIVVQVFSLALLACHCGWVLLGRLWTSAEAEFFFAGVSLRVGAAG